MDRFKFKILLIIVIGMLTAESHACQFSSRGNSNHLVVTIEGLMGRSLGSQAQRTADALNRGNYTVLSCAQDTDSELSIASQILNYRRANPNARISVMGHSLGGGDSVRLLARAGVTIDDLIVWDGRNGSEVTCGNGNGPKYRRPTNVRRVTNFYQCGFMPGRRFINESCVRNVQMPSGFMAHTSLPRNTRSIVNSVLNGPQLGPRPRCNETQTSTPPLLAQPQETPAPAPVRTQRPRIPFIRPRSPIPVLGGSPNCTGPTPQQIRQYNLSARAQRMWCTVQAGGQTYGEQTIMNSDR